MCAHLAMLSVACGCGTGSWDRWVVALTLSLALGEPPCSDSDVRVRPSEAEPVSV